MHFFCCLFLFPHTSPYFSLSWFLWIEGTSIFVKAFVDSDTGLWHFIVTFFWCLVAAEQLCFHLKLLSILRVFVCLMVVLWGSREHHPNNFHFLLGIDHVGSMPPCFPALCHTYKRQEELLFTGKWHSRNCAVPHSYYEYFCSVNHQWQIIINDTEIVKKLKMWHSLCKSFKCL